MDPADWVTRSFLVGSTHHSTPWCPQARGPVAESTTDDPSSACATCRDQEWTMVTLDPEVSTTTAILLKARSALARAPRRNTHNVLSARRAHLAEIREQVGSSVVVEGSRAWHRETSERLDAALAELNSAVLARRAELLDWCALELVAAAPPLDQLPARLVDAFRASEPAPGAPEGPEGPSSTRWGPRVVEVFGSSSHLLVCAGVLTRGWREHCKASKAKSAERTAQAVSRTSASIRHVLADSPAALLDDLDLLVEDSFRVLDEAARIEAAAPGSAVIARPQVFGDPSTKARLDAFSSESVFETPAVVGSWVRSLSTTIGLEAVLLDENLDNVLLEVLRGVFDPTSEVRLAEALEAARALAA